MTQKSCQRGKTESKMTGYSQRASSGNELCLHIVQRRQVNKNAMD